MSESIILTGGAGFIGSALAAHLNSLGIEKLFLVDHLGTSEKWQNLRGLRFQDYLEKEDFLSTFETKSLGEIEAVIHLGACTDTTEHDASYLVNNNYEYTVRLLEACLNRSIPFFYASSAATYGSGHASFEDSEDRLDELSPLNAYALSKHLVDLYILRRNLFTEVVGWKFFNVFGPNEYHKGEMRSVICKAYYEIKERGEATLFCSHREGIPHGEQKRDFLYIKDCVKVITYFLQHKGKKGLYNVGTGTARSFNDGIKSLFQAQGLEPKIRYVPMPLELREKYQYYTSAPIEKLRRAGYQDPFTPLEDAVQDYVQNYLATGKTLDRKSF